MDLLDTIRNAVAEIPETVGEVLVTIGQRLEALAAAIDTHEERLNNLESQ